MKRMILGFAAVLLGCGILALPAGALADTTIPVNLGQLSQYADAVVKGVVNSVVPGKIGPFRTVRVTMSVEEVVKGEIPGPTFSFSTVVAKGDPPYEVDKRYWLFLTAESRMGLRAPVGIEQGIFLVQEAPSGKALVVNGRNNAGLFREATKTKGLTKAMSVGGFAPQGDGPVDGEAFSRAVKALVSQP